MQIRRSRVLRKEVETLKLPAFADCLYRRYEDHRVRLVREEVEQRFKSNLQRLYETYGKAVLVQGRSDTLFIGNRLAEFTEIIRWQTPFKVGGDLVGDPMLSRYGRLFSRAWEEARLLGRQPSRQPGIDTVREELIIIGAVCLVAFELGLITPDEHAHHGQTDSGRCPVVMGASFMAPNREA